MSRQVKSTQGVLIMRSMFEKSDDTRIIENALRQTADGNIMLYADLSSKLGRDVRQLCAGNLATAKKNLVSESIFFGVVRGIGLKRLSNEEALLVSKSHLLKSRKSAKRAVNSLMHVDYGSLSADGKKQHCMQAVQSTLILMSTASKYEKKLEEKIVDKPISIDESLKLF